MKNNFPTIAEFENKADIARKILYKNDYTLYNLEELYKGKTKDESYYKSVKEIRDENINPFYFLENYNKGCYMVALNFWDFELNQDLICSHCGKLNIFESENENFFQIIYQNIER